MPPRVKATFIEPMIFGYYDGDRLLDAARIADGHLRHIRFVALRSDKTPESVVREERNSAGLGRCQGPVCGPLVPKPG